MSKPRSPDFARLREFVPLILSCVSITCSLIGSEVNAQIMGGADINTSQKDGPDVECAIAKNPSDSSQLFAACNSAGGLFAVRSVDGGNTWSYPDPADKTIADGDQGQGPLACCDPTVAWDSFGNLYVGYLDNYSQTVVILISTDAGLSFNPLVTFAGSVDQPTITAADTPDAEAPVAVWVVWHQGNSIPGTGSSMRASGAPVTGIGAGAVGPFSTPEVIPGTNFCTFGDVAIAPTGVVVQACQQADGTPGSIENGPASILIYTDTDGLGPGTFGGPIVATATNVGMLDSIPPQDAIWPVDAEAGLAYDRFPASPHFGRLYLVYTDETALENDDTDILLRYSDDDGATWSDPPIRVNDDDPADPIRSQFLPRIASDPQSGNILVCWYDPRNSANNDAMQEYCSIAYPDGATPAFSPNAAIGDALSTNAPMGYFGDYSGLVYSDAVAHPMWADTSNSTGDNPDGTSDFDAYTDRVSGAQLSDGCEPCIPIIKIIWIFLIVIIFVVLVVIGIIRWLIRRQYLNWST